MTGEDEDESEGASEVEEDDGVQEEIESIETEKAAEDAVAVEKPSENDDIPPGAPELDAVISEEPGPEVPVAEPSAEPPQEEESSPPAISTTVEPSAEEQTVDAPVDIMEPENQVVEESIKTADVSAEQVAAPETSVADEPVEVVNEDSKCPDTAPEIHEGPVIDPQQLDHSAEDIATGGIEAVETLEQTSDEPSSTEITGEDISQEGQPSQYVPEEPGSAKEIVPMPQDSESGAPAVPTESDETDTVEVLAESENTSDTPPVEPIEDPDEIVQIVDVNGDGSTDYTAAIVVVPIPPPPPTAPHVTIVEPIKPPKSSKRKSSSSKSSRSRSVEKLKERPIEIIPLKEGKSRIVAKGKGEKKKSKSSSGNGGEDLVTPPPPMIVDVPPRAPSPPPSGLVIEVVGDETVQVVDSSAEKKGDSAEDNDIATVPETGNEPVEVVEAEEDSILAMNDQEKDNVETKAQEEDVAPVEMLPPPLEADVTASSLENSGSDADGVKPQLTHEESASQLERILASAEDPPVDDLPDSSLPEHTPIEEPDPTEATSAEVESHDQVAPEGNVVSAEDTNNGGTGSSSPEPSIGSEDSKESTAEGALEEPMASVTVETDPTDISKEDVARSTVAEDTLEPLGESKNTVVEVVTEAAPTLMELVDLIIPHDSASGRTRNTAVSEAVPADTDVSTKEVDCFGGVSDTIPKAGVGEDNDPSTMSVVTVLPDEEDAINVPPEAPMPTVTDVPESKLESRNQDEDSKHQTSVEATEGVKDEDIEPEDMVKVVAPDLEVALAEEDLESTPVDQSRDIAPEHPAEVVASDETVVGELESILDSNASPIQVEQTPEADVSMPSDDANVHKEEDEQVANLVEETTELAETVPATLNQLDLSSAAVNEPEAFKEAEAQQDSPDCDPDDTGIYSIEKIDAATVEEEEALATSADGTGAQDLVLLAIDQVGEEVASVVPEPDHSQDVISHHVIGDVEEPAIDEVENVSEPCVVESAGAETCKTTGETVSANSTKSPDTEDLSEQPVKSPAHHLSDKEEDATIDPADITDHATTSTIGDGAQTEEQDSPDLPMPMLAEETQIVQVIEAPEEIGKDLSKTEGDETKKAEESVDTAPSLEETLGSNETSSPEQQPQLPAEEQLEPSTEEHANELPQLEDAPAPEEPVASAEQVEPDTEAQCNPHEREPVTEAEVLPEDSISQQQYRCETILDSEPVHEPPGIGEPVIDQPAPVEAAEPPPSKPSSKVSFDGPPVSTKDNEPTPPPKERRKSSKSSKSSSHRHSTSHHKVKDVSYPPSEPQSSTYPSQSRRRSSTVQAPPLGLFRKPSSAKPRSSRAEAAEQAELRRRAAELAAREEDVQRQLRRARKLAALEEQERQLREKEEELARLEAVEREKKRARHEERRRREQEALEQERERAEEVARQKELERAERRRQRKEAESLEGRRHRDGRPRVRRHKTEHTDGERQRSRDDYYVREAPSSSKEPEQRRHRRSSRRESDEKPKKGFWKSLLGKV
jgi:hypothetical protein